MAVVGEAHIIVRAITNRVADDIRNSLRGVGGDVNRAASTAGQSVGLAFLRGFNRSGSNVFSSVADQLRGLVPDAEQAALSFRRLSRTSLTLGPAIAGIIGGISALIGALGALVGAAGGAAVSLLGVVSAAIQLRAGFAIAGFALKGIGAAVSAATDANSSYSQSVAKATEELQKLKFEAEEAALSQDRAALNLEKAREALMKAQDLPVNSRARREAELAFREAELSYRRAKDRNQDIAEEIESGAGVGGQDPYANLTPSQKEFAKFLVSLKGTIDELREAVARGLLPSLEKGITDLQAAFGDRLEPALESFGKSLGTAVDNFVSGFTAAGGPEKVLEFFALAGPNIEQFGRIAGELFGAVVDLLVEAEPLTDGFISFLSDSVKNFSDFLRSAKEDGSLQQFFTKAMESANLFGQIIGNIFNFFGDIVGANVGEDSPGGDLLKFFRDATAGLASLGDSAEGGTSPIRDFFQAAVDNAKPVLSLLGGILKAFLDVGTNENIGKAFETLAAPENIETFTNFLNELADSAPTLAAVGVALGDIIAAITDSGAADIFLGILKEGFEFIRDILENEVVKGFLDFIGRIFAAISAITLFLGGFKLIGKVIFGFVIRIASFIGSILGAIGTVQSFFLRLILSGAQFLGLIGRIGLFLTGPLGIAIGVITTALTFFFTQTELGKQIWEGFANFIGEAWNKTVENIGKGWDQIVGFFSNFGPNIANIFKGIINTLLDFWEGLVNGVINGINTGIIAGLNSFKIDIPQWIRDAAAAIGIALPARAGFSIPPIAPYRIPRLAEGGVVMPSAGGTIARVAEAGRPERIEPLDPDGLSARDRAMIRQLSGGGMTINVYPSAGMDERELANMVSRRIAAEIRRGTV